MKVHFAGIDAEMTDKCLLDYGIRYRLSSYYYLRKNKKFLPDKMNEFEHSIIDSGLFTLMFGAGSGKECTEETLIKWKDEYISWINSFNWRNTSFVECDVQKKLSSEIAWEIRKEMKQKVNQGTVINVYHLEDENPDKIIEFSDYIAISIPELRIFVSDKERFSITKYIATKATLKGKRVHLLGCTEESYLKYFSFCYSCDSTSWMAPLRYGEVKTSYLTTHVRDIEKLTGLSNYNLRNKGIVAYLHQQEYKKQSGNQW